MNLYSVPQSNIRQFTRNLVATKDVESLMEVKEAALKKKWNTADGHSPYVSLFNSLHPIEVQMVQYLDRQSFYTSLPKGRFLAKPGTPCDGLYLILKGVVRAFRKIGKKQITTWINEENEIVGSIQDLGFLDKSSVEFIEVIEDAEFVALHDSSIQHLYSRYLEANIIGRKILEESYRAAEERAFLCRIPSAILRYKLFLEHSPQLVNRISLKYIASYLGMTIETLSRVRNQRS